MKWLLVLLMLIVPLSAHDIDNCPGLGPCTNGICVQNENGFMCYCQNGFTGLHCQVDHDECSSNPCMNFGHCIDAVASFSCECMPGYQGELCEQNVDECLSNPCHNNGTCQDAIDSYKCLCKPGYSGDNCEVDISVCNLTSSTSGEPLKHCMNGGECVDGPGYHYKCLCSQGFQGKNCEEDVDECEQNPCLNGAKCENLVSDFKCFCMQGWTGKLCDEKAYLCQDFNPCKNGGVCITDYSIVVNGEYLGVNTSIMNDSPSLKDIVMLPSVQESRYDFTCYCVPDFHGNLCQYQYDNCLPHPKCQENEICVDGINSYCCNTTVKCGNDSSCGRNDTCVQMTSISIISTSASTMFPTESFASSTYFYSSSTLQVLSTIYTFSARTSLPDTTILTSTLPSTSLLTVPDPTSDIFESISPTAHSSSLVLEATSSMNMTSMESASSTVMQTIMPSASVQSRGPTQTLSYVISVGPRESSASFSISPHTVLPPSTEYYNSISSYETFQGSEITRTTESEISPVLPTVGSHQTSAITIFPSQSVSELSSSIELPSLYETITATAMPSMTSDQQTSTSDVFVISTGPSSYSTSLFISPSPPFTLETQLFSSSDFQLMSSLSSEYEQTVAFPSSEDLETASVHETMISTFSISDFDQTTLTDFSGLGPRSPDVISATSDFSISTTSVFETTSMAISPTPIVQHGCSADPCQNGGICLPSTENKYDFKCLCPLLSSGPKCENEIQIEIPYFVGNSFIVQNVSEVSFGEEMEVNLSFHCFSENGIIMLLTWAFGPSSKNTFLFLRLHDGAVSLEFSCSGEQSISLIDSTKISEMDIVDVTIRYSHRRNSQICSSSIRVNNSTSFMTGSQKAVKSMEPENVFMYLGGVDELSFPPMSLLRQKIDEMKSGEGFVGCIYNLTINGVDMELVSETSFGKNILECEEVFCDTSPCLNNGTCIRDGTAWYCSCQTGFDGALCERHTCENAPCLNGGTCLLMYYGLGFSCMCPYGFQGVTCQDEIEIKSPFFAGMASGYSSYISFLRPSTIFEFLELKIIFKTAIPSQDSVLFYVGPEDAMHGKSDYLAIGLYDEHVALQFDLGSGSVLLKSSKRVIQNETVTAFVGRHFQTGWVYIQGSVNVTGKSSGKARLLTVVSDLFVGGHPSYQHTFLPHLPFIDGFQGCVLEVALKTSPRGNFEVMQTVEYGRNVLECQHKQCFDGACKNNGECVDTQTVYRCECQDGWTSDDCSIKSDSICRSECDNGGQCFRVMASNGSLIERCDCKLGFDGLLCQNSTEISTPFFSGRNSYLALQAISNVRHMLLLDIIFKSNSKNGLLFYMAKYLNEKSGDFISLSLNNGFLELRYNLGSSSSSTTIVSSRSELQTGTAIEVNVITKSTNSYLYINGSLEAQGKATNEMVSLDTDRMFYLGGLPNLADINRWAVAKNPRAFIGCILDVRLNGHTYDLISDSSVGRNIENCETDECLSKQCKNGGTCHRNGSTLYCACAEGWFGEDCSMSIRCQNHECKNNASCIAIEGPQLRNAIRGMYKCDCQLGFHGRFCQNETLLAGSSAIGFEDPASYLAIRNLTFNIGALSNDVISFKFKAQCKSCVIMWSGAMRFKEEDYLGVGLQDGHLYMTWNVGGYDKNDVLTNLAYNDDAFHSVIIRRDKNALSMLVDGINYKVKLSGQFIQLNTNGAYFFGGFGYNENVKIRTNGYFDRSFKGCIGEIMFNNIEILSTVESYIHISARSIKLCGVG